MINRATRFLAVAFFAAAAVNSGEIQASVVVSTDAPALVLKDRTLADVQANKISGTAIGAHMRPRNMVGFNKTMLPAADGQPTRLWMVRAGKATEIYAWQSKWVEERLPIAPPAPGWTCEKLVDELVAAWEDFNRR